MGGAKKMMEHEDNKRGVAAQIAIDSGVLERCPIHEEILLITGNDITDAYKLGNAKISAGDFVGLFDDRRDMTDKIKEVVEDDGSDECGICARHRDE